MSERSDPSAAAGQALGAATGGMTGAAAEFAAGAPASDPEDSIAEALGPEDVVSEFVDGALTSDDIGSELGVAGVINASSVTKTGAVSPGLPVLASVLFGVAIWCFVWAFVVVTQLVAIFVRFAKLHIRRQQDEDNANADNGDSGADLTVRAVTTSDP